MYRLSVMSRRRWLACWGLLAGAYLALGLIRGLSTADPGSVRVHLVAAVVTFGFAAAVLPVILPRHGRNDDDATGGDGPGDGGGDPPPSWWPEFERQFRWHVRTSEGPAAEREEGRESSEDVPAAGSLRGSPPRPKLD